MLTNTEKLNSPQKAQRVPKTRVQAERKQGGDGVCVWAAGVGWGWGAGITKRSHVQLFTGGFPPV